MKKIFLSGWLVLAASVLTVVLAQQPSVPQNLQADVLGHKVTLRWENPDVDKMLITNDFEMDNVEPGEQVSLEQDGWTVRTTNTSYYACTWFSYPTAEFMDLDNYEIIIGNGKRSAAIFLDVMEEDGHAKHQDEWLISPVLDKAAYLRFSYYIDPRVVADGVYPEFPDHYVVLVSTDGGQTWSDPLWDARYDASTEDSWHTVMLALTDEPTSTMQVAFRAYGEWQVDPETGDTINQGLNATWAIDDVTLFTAKDPSAIISTYRIELDGEKLADVKGVDYADKSEKPWGEHTYSVYSVTADGLSSEAATVTVDLQEIVFAAPRNFVCTPVLDETTGKYNVTMTWDAPQTNFKPSHYTLYSDKAICGTELTEEDGREGVGVTGCFGLYVFSIEAVYKSPDGVSERIAKRLALGVRYGVNDLKAEVVGKDVLLSWAAPEESEYPMGSYTVYRGGEKLAEGITETSWRDENVENGHYQYVVIAVYADGEAVRTGIDCQVGEPVRVKLPYEQSFDTTFCPDNWKIENQSGRTPDKYSWYFDDKSRLGITGRGFDGCYAAIDCRNSGYYWLNATLAMPAIDLTSAVNRENLTLFFNYSYAIGGILKAGVEFSFDGEEWFILHMLSKEDGYDPDDGAEDFNIRLAEIRLGDFFASAGTTDLEDAETIYLRFRYEAIFSHYWAIDNVWIGEAEVSVEKPVEDIDVTVSSANGLLKVRAGQEIKKVEVFSIEGMRLAEQTVNGQTETTMRLSRRGTVIVRVITAQGVKVVKLFV